GRSVDGYLAARRAAAEPLPRPWPRWTGTAEVHDEQGALRHHGGATQRGGDRRGESALRLARAGDQFAGVALEPARSGPAVQRRLERGARFSPVEGPALGHSAVVCAGGGTNRGP